MSVLKKSISRRPRTLERRVRGDPERLPDRVRAQPDALRPALRRDRHAPRLHVLDRGLVDRGDRARAPRAARQASASSASCSASARPATGPARRRRSASGSRSRERALGMGIFNTGAAVGGALSPPLIAWLATDLRLAADVRDHRRPGLRVARALARALPAARSEHPWLDRRGARLHPRRPRRRRSADAAAEPGAPAGSSCSRYRQTWAIVVAPLHHRSDLVAVRRSGCRPTSRRRAASACSRSDGRPGSRFSPAASARSRAAGPPAPDPARLVSVDRARKTVMTAGALLTPAGILAMRAESPYVALAWMGVVLFGFQVWVNNVQTLPSDFFPGSAVASVAGLGGTAAALASVLYNWGTGRVVDLLRLHAGVRRRRGPRAVGPGGPVPARGPDREGAGVEALESRARRPRAAPRAPARFRRGYPGLAHSRRTRSPPSTELLVADGARSSRSLVGVHPRVFVTAAGLDELRAARPHDASRGVAAGASLAAGARRRPAAAARSAGAALAERRRVRDRRASASPTRSSSKPEYLLAAAKKWTLAAIDYEPWGYTYNKPNVDLAAGHLLYAIGWAYDLLYARAHAGGARADPRLARAARGARLRRTSRPARSDSNSSSRRTTTSSRPPGSASRRSRSWASRRTPSAGRPRAYAHHHRAGQLLSPGRLLLRGLRVLDLLGAVARALPRRLGARDRREPVGAATCSATGRPTSRTCSLPDGQNVFDFGDIWEGAAARASGGARSTARVYPGGTLQSNCNVLYRRRRAPPRSGGAGGRGALRAPSATATSRSTGRCCGATRRSRPRR